MLRRSKARSSLKPRKVKLLKNFISVSSFSEILRNENILIFVVLLFLFFAK